jgi:acetyl-CoA synthetase
VGDFTYGDLQEHSNRFANVLGQLGVAPGERVFALAGRIPALYIAALGTLKHRGVFCPLFSAFGPEPIYQHLSQGDAKVLVTTERLYRQKIADLRQRLPWLQQVLLVDVEQDLGDGLWSLPRRLASESAAPHPQRMSEIAHVLRWWSIPVPVPRKHACGWGDVTRGNLYSTTKEGNHGR